MQLTLAEGARLTASSLEEWGCTAAHADNVMDLVTRLVVFAERAFAVETFEDLDVAVARAFIDCVSVHGEVPAVSVRHRRRNALRLLFRAARSHGACVGDPTMDIALPARAQMLTRPLATDEVVVCRASASWSLTETRRAAAWALAEATAGSRELACVRIRDLDLANQRVWIHGGRVTRSRWGLLGPWGIEQLNRRIHNLDGDPQTPLLYRGSGGDNAGRVSVALALGDILRRAGLAGEPDIRPASVIGWAGSQILAETGRIDEVARRLGMSSLDRAARRIGWSWNETAP